MFPLTVQLIISFSLLLFIFIHVDLCIYLQCAMAITIKHINIWFIVTYLIYGVKIQITLSNFNNRIHCIKLSPDMHLVYRTYLFYNVKLHPLPSASLLPLSRDL